MGATDETPADPHPADEEAEVENNNEGDERLPDVVSLHDVQLPHHLHPHPTHATYTTPAKHRTCMR